MLKRSFKNAGMILKESEMCLPLKCNALRWQRKEACRWICTKEIEIVCVKKQDVRDNKQEKMKSFGKNA